MFGPKPKRRTELGLLVFGSLLIVALYVIAALGQYSKLPPDLGPFLGVILGLALLAHMANRWLVPNANAVILPLAALLNGIGYVVIARWDHWYPGEARNQAVWTAAGVGLYVLTLIVVRFSRDLERYRYLLLLLAGILLVSPLFFSPINGARLWVHFGSFEFQPIEFSKILLCIFFASYFAENKEMLSIPTAQIGNRLFLDPRPLIPIIVAWGAAMAIIGLEDDIGFAALLFVLFIGMLWVTTGRVGYLALGLVLFGVGAYIAAHYFVQVHLRVDEWLNPWGTAAERRRLPAQPGLVQPGHGRHRRDRVGLRPFRVVRPRADQRHDLRRHRHRDGHGRAQPPSSWPSFCSSVPASGSPRRPDPTSPG